MKQPSQVNILTYCLENKIAPKGGLLFQERLFKQSVAFSQTGINNLAFFIDYLNQKKETTQSLLEQSGGKNLLLLLSVFIVKYIEKHTDKTIIWQDNNHILGHQHKSNIISTIDDDWFEGLIIHIKPNHLKPLALLKQHIDHPTKRSDDISFSAVSITKQTNFSIVRAINNFILKVNAQNLQNKADFCRKALAKIQYLQKIPSSGQEQQVFADFTISQQPIAFASYCQYFKLNYGINSIKIIDDVLLNLKQKEQLNPRNYQDFVNDPAKAHFLYIIAHYVGLTSAKLSHNTLKWLTFADACHLLESEHAPDVYEYQHIAQIGAKIYFPLYPVITRLFENEAVSCVDFVMQVVRHDVGHLKNHSVQSKLSTDSAITIQMQQTITKAAQMVTQLFLAKQSLIKPSLEQSLENLTLTDVKQFSVYTDIKHKTDETNTQSPLQTTVKSISHDSYHQAIDGLNDKENAKLPMHPNVVHCFVYEQSLFLYHGKKQTMVVHLISQSVTNKNIDIKLYLPFKMADKKTDKITLYAVLTNQPIGDSPYIEHVIAYFYQKAFALTEKDKQKSFWQTHFFQKKLPHLTSQEKTHLHNDNSLLNLSNINQSLNINDSASVNVSEQNNEAKKDSKLTPDLVNELFFSHINEKVAQEEAEKKRSEAILLAKAEKFLADTEKPQIPENAELKNNNKPQISEHTELENHEQNNLEDVKANAMLEINRKNDIDENINSQQINTNSNALHTLKEQVDATNFNPTDLSDRMFMLCVMFISFGVGVLILM